MTGEEAVAYVWSHGWEAHAPGLDRIRELLRRLGDPQKGLRFIRTHPRGGHQRQGQRLRLSRLRAGGGGVSGGAEHVPPPGTLS